MLAAYKKYWKQYVDFQSTSSRSDFWWTMLVNFLINFVLTIIFIVTIIGSLVGNKAANIVIANHGLFAIAMISMIALMIYSLATIIPTIALSIRRIRDTGLSPWWYLLQLVSIFGSSFGYYDLIATGNANNVVGSFVSLLASLALFIMYVSPTNQFNKKLN